MTAFFIALFLVFIAEMGDKTQLVALGFATRYRPGLVLGAIFSATLLIHLFSVLIGEILGLTLPVFGIKILAGLAFIGFGLWTLRGDELDEAQKQKLNQNRLGPFMTVATTFFIAELGDKTMLATVAIASQQQSFIAVWIGSTIGMVLADGLAVITGAILGQHLPERVIKITAAVIFIGSGIVTLLA